MWYNVYNLVKQCLLFTSKIFPYLESGAQSWPPYYNALAYSLYIKSNSSLFWFTVHALLKWCGYLQYLQITQWFLKPFLSVTCNKPLHIPMTPKLPFTEHLATQKDKSATAFGFYGGSLLLPWQKYRKGSTINMSLLILFQVSIISDNRCGVHS